MCTFSLTFLDTRQIPDQIKICFKFDSSLIFISKGFLFQDKMRQKIAQIQLKEFWVIIAEKWKIFTKIMLMTDICDEINN